MTRVPQCAQNGKLALTGFAQRRQRLLVSVSRVSGAASDDDERAAAT
jgi:hypothetical protein